MRGHSKLAILRQTKNCEMKPRLVMVDWIDATSYSGWRERKDFLKSPCVLCRTVGYLVGDDGECLKMAGSCSDEGIYNDRSAIPKGCVIRKVTLDVRLPKLARAKKK